MRGKSKIHIGTSGWNYNHWQGPFYPNDLPSSKWLGFYAERFHTVEINNSFYQLPPVKTFESWRDSTPDGFFFAVKASRYMTHMKKLKDPEEPVKRFFANVRGLGKKTGPILFQLPPHWKCNPDRLESFLEALPGTNRYTFEFRDGSWWTNEVYELLSRHKAAFCIYDLAGQQSPKEVTASFVYVRLHGPEGAYQGRYGPKRLGGWMGAFAAWARQGKEVYCYFDNDQAGYAAQDALRMVEMLETPD